MSDRTIKIAFGLILISGGLWSQINYFVINKQLREGKLKIKKSGYYLGNMFGLKRYGDNKSQQYLQKLNNTFPIPQILYHISNLLAVLLGLWFVLNNI